MNQYMIFCSNVYLLKLDIALRSNVLIVSIFLFTKSDIGIATVVILLPASVTTCDKNFYDQIMISRNLKVIQSDLNVFTKYCCFSFLVH